DRDAGGHDRGRTCPGQPGTRRLRAAGRRPAGGRAPRGPPPGARRRRLVGTRVVSAQLVTCRRRCEMTDPARVRRHAERIRELVATVVRTQIKDPRLGTITITDARITADLRDATVFSTAR